jgi:hypothetical protein
VWFETPSSQYYNIIIITSPTIKIAYPKFPYMVYFFIKLSQKLPSKKFGISTYQTNSLINDIFIASFEPMVLSP